VEYAEAEGDTEGMDGFLASECCDFFGYVIAV
jgi:hypothetical protein